MNRILVTVVLLFLFSAHTVADEVVPLPHDLRIVAPGPDVPEKLARWSGKWSGKWDRKLPHILVVQEIKLSGKVSVVYAWGNYAPWNVSADFHRFVGSISSDGDELELPKFPDGDQASYEFRPEYLTGRYVTAKGYVSKGRFKKAD